MYVCSSRLPVVKNWVAYFIIIEMRTVLPVCILPFHFLKSPPSLLLAFAVTLVTALVPSVTII